MLQAKTTIHHMFELLIVIYHGLRHARFFPTLGLPEFGWVSVVGENLRDITIQDICSDLGPSRYLILPIFYVIKVCEITPPFVGCGKKTARAYWQNTPGLTETLLTLTIMLEPLYVQNQERCVCHAYYGMWSGYGQ